MLGLVDQIAVCISTTAEKALVKLRYTLECLMLPWWTIGILE